MENCILCKHYLLIDDYTDDDIIKNLNTSICLSCIEKHKGWKDEISKQKYIKYQQDLKIFKDDYKKKNNWPF